MPQRAIPFNPEFTLILTPDTLHPPLKTLLSPALTPLRGGEGEESALSRFMESFLKKSIALVLAFLCGCQGGIVEIEAVEDLIVIVAWRGNRTVGEFARVGAFEEQGGGPCGSEVGMNQRIVKGVVLVAEDFNGRPPWPGGRVGFGVP